MAQVVEFVILLGRLVANRVVPLFAKQFSQQPVVMPAFVWRLDASQNIDVVPELTRLILAQLIQFPVVSPGLLPAALDNALFRQRMERVPAEPRAADTAIEAVQDVVPITVGHELCHRARAHATPVGAPAVVPAVDRDLALGCLIARVGFSRAVAAAEVLEEHGNRVETRRSGDHQLRHS